MILKKPYAFLIKYFRVIHFLLLFLLVNFAFEGRSVLQFFNSYVKNNYQTPVVSNLPQLYAPVSLIINVLVIIALFILMLILMIYKKKPFKLYVFTVLYYSIMLIVLFYIRGVLSSFSETLLAATTARSLRDVLFILYLPQYIFIICVLLRAVGFDLKKFDFASDLRKMNYTSQDAEEFEVNINLEVYKVEQKSRRFLREMLYYVKENRFVVICLAIAGGVVLLNYLRMHIHSNYDYSYGMNRTFMYNKANFSFEDAIISNMNYKGDMFPDKYYLAIRVHVTNDSGYPIVIDYSNFRLEIGNKFINPTINAADNFIDLASTNVTETLAHLSDNTFVLTYELKPSEINRVRRIIINNGVVNDKGKIIDKHIIINLNIQKIIGNVENVGNYAFNDLITFNNTYLKDTTMNVKSVSINNRYIYRYIDCITEDNCLLFDDMLTTTDGKAILVFDMAYNQDAKAGYSLNYTSLKSFADNFCFVQYRVDGEKYTSNINLTPISVDSFMAFEVPQNIEKADLIQLVITIRNKRYYVVVNP